MLPMAHWAPPSQSLPTQPDLRLIAMCRPVPLGDAIDHLPEQAGGRFYARIPDENTEIVAHGIAWEWMATSNERFTAARDAVTSALSSIRGNLAEYGFVPRAWGGFAFHDSPSPVNSQWAPFGTARWFIPAHQYVTRNGRAFEITISIDGEPPPKDAPRLAHARKAPADFRPLTDQNSGSDWNRLCAEALAGIERKRFEKLVVARAASFAPHDNYDMRELFQRVRAGHRGTFFAFEGAPDVWFASATPEKLLSIEQGSFKTHAVAGTSPRGESLDADVQIAERLLASEKDIREHAWVVESICAALRPLADSVSAAPAPLLMQLPGMQHMVTPIEGRMSAGVHLFDAAERLHPTAAVGGYPRDTASAWLQQHENFERGWYAAPIGFVDALGDGALWVAIRSGLFTQRQAILFAGAGIVAGSEPQREWDETELKLGALGQFLTKSLVQS